MLIWGLSQAAYGGGPKGTSGWQQPGSSGTAAATTDLVPPPKSLVITPSRIAIVVGEPQRLRVSDERGRNIPDAVWTVSDPALAEVRVNGVVRLTGLAPGKFTITATWRNLKAEARVTVVGELMAGQPQKTAETPPSGLEITPHDVAMVMGEPRWLRLCDENGLQIQSATWTSSNEALAKIRPGPDATIVTLAPGHVTVTANWEGREAQAEVNILPGPKLPPGTSRWSVQPTPGFSMKQLVQPQVTAGGPDLFLIEEDRCGRMISRAMTSDGRQLWRSQPFTLKAGPRNAASGAESPLNPEFLSQLPPKGQAGKENVSEAAGCSEPPPSPAGAVMGPKP